MSGNLLDYLEEYGDIPFSERGFCDADAIVLSQLCYCKFDSLVLGDDDVYLRDLIQSPDLDEMFVDPKYDKRNKNLVARLILGRRFRNMSLSRYVNIIDKETETQFSAITFKLPGDIGFVAFRGTDENMVGWKEDFNLSYMDEVPGQKYACMYLEEVAPTINGRFYVGGHSKGGHQAVYAAMHAPADLQKRFISVYCMDGPGFMDKMMNPEGYERIRDRLIKIIPQSSLIGLMQEHEIDRCKVIRASTWGFHQHNMYTWQFADGEIYPDELKDGARFFADTLNEWMLTIDPAQRQQAAEITYRIMTSCEADNRVDFMANFSVNAGSIINSLRDLDTATAELMRGLLSSLMSDVTRNLRSEVDSRTSPQIKDWVEEHLPGWMERLKLKPSGDRTDRKTDDRQESGTEDEPDIGTKVPDNGLGEKDVHDRQDSGLQ